MVLYGITYDERHTAECACRVLAQWQLNAPVLSLCVYARPAEMLQPELLCTCGHAALEGRGGLWVLGAAGAVRAYASSGDERDTAVDAAVMLGSRLVTASNRLGCTLRFSDGWSLSCSDVILGVRVTRNILPQQLLSVVACCYNGDTYLVDEHHSVLCFSLDMLVQSFALYDNTLVYLVDGCLLYYPMELTSYETRLFWPLHAQRVVDAHPQWGLLSHKQKLELIALLFAQ